ncbi:2-oxoglutarate (2OG) and Fe(II)-dependent oxygenase superfamily protein [Euphorbia peplus]|nr:2-oxoglutarate (2OG) and Fe(II)-dependent oxygenase superfamily protein [Euphorbia peplus]
MDKLVSTWCSNVESVPKDYVFPPQVRPGNFTFSVSDSIPVIDLGRLDRAATVQKILKASQEFGFFQVINHGVDEESIKNTTNVLKEFFKMPEEDKASVYSEDPTRSCRLCHTTLSYAGENVRLWREKLIQRCHPLHEHIQEWPQKPHTYREFVGNYTEEITKLGSRILELICEGLGLECGYFDGEMSENTTLSVNYYPPCPDPTLTCGIPPHCDPGLLTILLQDRVGGLQVLKDGEWIGVGPLPNSFVVNIGYTLQIISNNIVRSAKHRAVTNSKEDRVSAAFFINPSNETIIHPAKGLVDSCSHPLFSSFGYKDFILNYNTNYTNPQLVLERYKLQS